jgi:hypothetical protein
MKKFQTNDRIFAKVKNKNYPAWPACVTKIVKGSQSEEQYEINFYGTHVSGAFSAIVKEEDMWHFDKNTKAKFGKNDCQGFSEAINEIENRPQVGQMTEKSKSMLGKRKAETNEIRKSTRVKKTPNYQGNLLKGIVI